MRTIITAIFISFLFFLTYNCQRNTTKKDNVRLTGIDSLIFVLSEKIKVDANNPELYYQRSLLLLKKNKPTEALSDISKALQKEPQNTKYLITLADIYFAMGNLQNARKTLLNAADNEPNNVEPLLKIAEIDLILKDYEKMNLYLNKVLEIDKYNAQAFFMRGIAQKEQGDTTKAIKSFLEATKLNPEHFEAFLELGILYSRKNDPIAEQFLQTAININPLSSEARYALGLFYQNTEKLIEAISQYKTILDIDSTYAKAHHNLGYIEMVEYANYDEAIKHFTNAIKCDTNFIEAYYNRAYSYELMGEFDKAKKDYIRVLEKKANYPKAIEALNRIDRRN